jgi:hypothetical protein
MALFWCEWWWCWRAPAFAATPGGACEAFVVAVVDKRPPMSCSSTLEPVCRGDDGRKPPYCRIAMSGVGGTLYGPAKTLDVGEDVPA